MKRKKQYYDFLELLTKENLDISNDILNDFLFKKKNKLLELLKYKKFNDVREIEKILRKDEEYGVRSSLEKYINFYGEVEGKIKYKQKKSSAYNLEKAIEKHGEVEGPKIYAEYCRKMSYKNTFENKQNKYGWTKEQFDEYNKSRSVTKENLIKRHGEIVGSEKWESYIERQRYTCSEEYLGREAYEKFNRSRHHSFEVYLERYKDPKLAEEKLCEFKKKISVHFVSKKSQEMAWFVYNDILKEEEKEKCHFGELNGEYGVLSEEKRYYMYDFVNTKLKLVIEFHGDIFHGNPKKYSPDHVFNFGKERIWTPLECWKFDKIKEDCIRRLRDFDYIVVWEDDWDNNLEETKEKLREYINGIRNSRI